MYTWASPLGRVVVVRPETVTVLDQTTGPRLVAAAVAAIEAHPDADALMIDMIAVTACDDAAAASVAELARRMEQRGSRTTVLNASPEVYGRLDAAISPDSNAVIYRRTGGIHTTKLAARPARDGS